MNEDERIRKLLATVKSGEKGWRKTLAAAEGSYTRKLAQDNLHRLAVLRQSLQDQLNDAKPQ